MERNVLKLTNIPTFAFAFLCAVLFSFSGFGDVMLWNVDPQSTVHTAEGDKDLYTFLIPVPWTSEDNRPTIAHDTGERDEYGNPIYTYTHGDGKRDAIVAARVNVCDA